MLRFFGVAVAAIVGGLLAEGFGALGGAALAWLGWLAHRQAKDIAGLRRDVDFLTRHRAGSVPAESALVPAQATEQSATVPSAAPTGPVAQPAPTQSPATTLLARDGAPVESKWADEPHDTEVGSLWGDVPGVSTRGAAESHGTRLLAPIKQWLFGGNTIVKLGVAILFIGLAFLAKFAAEHVSIPVELRLAGIGGAALVLLAIGWRLRDSRAGYAQVLQGGAVAVLYLTLFVAFRFYGVLGVAPVFACMVGVAALAAALAVMQDARALAVIGALGGFATPLLVSTGGGNHVALFGYYLVLDLGIAAVAWHRSWRLLNLIGFFATFGVGAAWGATSYRDEHYLSAQAFLTAFFLVFVAILLMPARRALRYSADGDLGASTATRSDTWVNGSLLFGLPTIAFALQYAMVRDADYGTAISALLLALFYVGVAAWMRKRARLAVMFEASLAIATVFLTLVIPFALDAHSTSGAWALEGAGLVWLGLRQRRIAPRLFGYALLFLAGLAMFHAVQRHGVPHMFFNALLFNGVMAGAASLAAAYFVHRSGRLAAGDAAVATPDQERPQSDEIRRPPHEQLSSRRTPGTTLGRAPSSWIPAFAGMTFKGEEETSGGRAFPHEAIAEPLLIGWGTLWLLMTAASQISNFTAPHLQLTAWLVCVSAIALIYTGLSLRLDWPRIAWPALGHAPLLGLAVAVSALNQDSPSQDGGAWAWPLALATHLILLWRAAQRWPARAADAVHGVGLLVLAALGALQGRAITRDWGDPASAWAWLGWLLVPAALLLLVPRAGFALRWPVRISSAAYQTHAAGVLAAGMLLWSLLANIASSGGAAPLPHVPLLNPLDLGIGIGLLAVWLWMRSPPASALLARQPNLAVQVTAVAGFVWLNAMLIRGFHHYGDVPYRVHAWIDSLAVQSGVSLLWSATALVLMWLAARRALRTPWMVGAVLLGAVSLKLVLVDLSGTGTVTRIVSFIGVGVLMLVIGYVAPLPAATREDSRAPA